MTEVIKNFFIAPIIPFSIFIALLKNIDKIELDEDEKSFFERMSPKNEYETLIFDNFTEGTKYNLNLLYLYNYENFLKPEEEDLIERVIIKIGEQVDEKYKELVNDLTFTKDSFFELTNYNRIFYKLLKKRKFTQIFNPWNYDKIGITIGLTDISPISDVPISKFKLLETNEEKTQFIKDLIDIKDVKSLGLSRDILAKSIVDPKINTITRILSNKSILTYLLSQSEGKNFIPFSVSFERPTRRDKFNEIEEIIDEFKNDAVKNNLKYFVLKPSSGTLSDGILVDKIENLTLDLLINHINNPENNKYASIISNSNEKFYPSWILSEFIQSFLWKFNRPVKTKELFPYIFDSTRKINELNYNFSELLPIDESNKIETIIKDGKFEDKIGRINKFRFWVLWSIIDGKFTSYIYNQGYVEICMGEWDKDFKNKNLIDPADIDLFYKKLFNFSNEDGQERTIRMVYREIIYEFNEKKKDNPNLKFDEFLKSKSEIEQKIIASVLGTYLDFAQIVNEDNYPLGTEKWGELMIELKKLVNILFENEPIGTGIKKNLTCMNDFLNVESKGCFSYFAMDIIINEENKPYILEINTRPFVGFQEEWMIPLGGKDNILEEHVIPVEKFLNSVLVYTLDQIIVPDESMADMSDVNKFEITNPFGEQLKRNNNIYVPISSDYFDKQTSKIYRKMYKILENNNFTSFPYPKYIPQDKSTILFRGMTEITKHLLSEIKTKGVGEYLRIMRELFPYDAKMQILNRITFPTLTSNLN